MGDTDVYDYTDGIFLGRYNTQAQGGVGAYDDGGSFDYNSDGITLSQLGTNLPIPTADLAYRVDVDLYNALYVQDIRKKYLKPRTTDISKNLLISARNIARNQDDKNYTSTTIIDEAGRTHNALDVFNGKRSDDDKFRWNYLETIHNKFFTDKPIEYTQYNIDITVPNKSITYTYDGSGYDTYKYTSLGFGSSTYGYDYSGIFTSSKATHNGVSYNKLMTLDYSGYNNYLQLYNTFRTYTTTQRLTDLNKINTSSLDTDNPIITTTKILNTNNTIVLLNKKTHSISFYGMVTTPCKISVVYVFNKPGLSGGNYNYWIEQTQYDTSIKKSGNIKFGFNIDNINAPFITLIFRDPNTGTLLNNVSTFEIYASYSYINTTYTDNIDLTDPAL